MSRNAEILHAYAHECIMRGEDPMQEILSRIRRVPFFGRLLAAYFIRRTGR